jgi:hypothetical protein
MTFFLEVDNEGNEIFVERNKPGGMTHYEMRAVAQREVANVDAKIEELITLKRTWGSCVRWNQEFIDKGEGDVYR